MSAPLVPCKHLDYSSTSGPDIVLETCAPHYPEVRFWRRSKMCTDNELHVKPNLEKMQFCGKGYGRINGIFQCYIPGEMPCYEPEEPEEPS